MIQQLYDVLLHKLTKHTNVSIPYSRYISGDTFPEQDSELLNTVITLKYRDHNIIETPEDSEANRPPDDEPFEPFESNHTSGDPYEVYSIDCIVVRADSSEPFRLIAISTDYTRILVNSTRIGTDGEPAYKHLVSEYPVQDNKFFGLEIKNQYAGEINELNAVSIRCDSCEPCYAVLMEFLGTTNMIRFVLGDEMFSILRDYYDINGDYDYNNAGAKEEESYVDVDCHIATHRGLTNVKNIDGGSASNLWRLIKDRRAGELEYFGPDEHHHEIDPDAPPITDFDMETLDVTNEGMFNYGDIDTGDETAEGDWNFGNINPEGEYDDPESIPDVREEVYIDYEKGETYYILEPEVELTDSDRAIFLQRLMEGKVIYGTVSTGTT